jgi:hypothetical protein
LWLVKVFVRVDICLLAPKRLTPARALPQGVAPEACGSKRGVTFIRDACSVSRASVKLAGTFTQPRILRKLLDE